MTALNIVPECYVDTKLAEILVQSSKKFNHQKGHGQVANKMQFALNNQYALGIIDQDTVKVRKAAYFSNFITIKQEHDLLLQKHPHQKHYLIIINPAIEKWLLNNAVVTNTFPADFSLGNQLQDLIDFTKTKNIDKNLNFIYFVKELLRKEAPGITLLKNWLEKFLSGKDLEENIVV